MWFSGVGVRKKRSRGSETYPGGNLVTSDHDDGADRPIFGEETGGMAARLKQD